MATALQTTDSKLPTLSPEQRLAASHLAKLDSDLGVFDLPALTAEQIGIAHVAIAAFEDAMIGAGTDTALALVAKLSMLLPKKNRSDAEGQFLAETYAEALEDIPADILTIAYKRIIRERKFFPTIKEVRDAARPELSKRSWLLMRLKLMVERGPAEPPKEFATPEETAAIKAEMGLSEETSALLDRIVGSEAA